VNIQKKIEYDFIGLLLNWVLNLNWFFLWNNSDVNLWSDSWFSSMEDEIIFFHLPLA